MREVEKMPLLINDIINIDTAGLKQLSPKDLERIVKRGKKYANQRLEKLEKAGLDVTSPAYQVYKDVLKDGRFDLTSGNRLRQISDLRKLQKFLQTKTSTVKGAQSYEKRLSKLLPNIPRNHWKSFWIMYTKLINENRIRAKQLSSNEIVVALQDIYDASASIEKVLKDMEDKFNELYNKANETFKSYAIDPRKFR